MLNLFDHQKQQSNVMTTVLAQDHFYSDFLSLHVSVKTNNNAMMMLLLPCTGKDASGLAPAGLRTSHRAARLPTEWLKKHCVLPRLPLVPAPLALEPLS